MTDNIARFAPLGPPSLSFAFELRAQVGARVRIEGNGSMLREFTPVLGGVLVGERIDATVQPHGGDWSEVSDGIFRLDARYTVRTNDDVVIDVHNQGIAHADEEVFALLASGVPASLDRSYFRTTPTFKTDHPDYRWLIDRTFVGVGREFGKELVLHIFQVA